MRVKWYMVFLQIDMRVGRLTSAPPANGNRNVVYLLLASIASDIVGHMLCGYSQWMTSRNYEGSTQLQRWEFIRETPK